MLDTSELPFKWNLILFAPTLLAILVATISRSGDFDDSPTLLITWLVTNLACSFWCANKYKKNKVTNTLQWKIILGLGLLFCVLNAGLSFFLGCNCAIVASTLFKR